MARRDHENDDDERSAAAANGGAMSDEEAIRAKLRESGWEKKTRKESHDDDGNGAEKSGSPSAARKNSDGGGDRKARDEHEKDRESRRRGSRGGSARRDRRSRSHRRDRDRDDRRERDSRRRARDRSSKRGKPSSRRRSRSHSKSRSRSPSRSRRVSSSHKRRGASPSRSASKGRERRGSKKASRSLSAGATRTKKDRDATDTDTDLEEHAKKDKLAQEGGSNSVDKDVGEAMEIDEHGDSDKKPSEAEKDGDDDGGEKSKKRVSSSAQRKSRKSSRHARSESRSPSRSSRRRRHRSRSRSPSMSRSSRRRRSSRSRSRSRPRRSDHRRRRSPSRSRSNSRRRRHRSSSKDKKRRDSNSSPQPHEQPAGIPPMAVAPPAAPALVNVNPTITQLMAQYPTMSLQDIITKMQASNVTMAATVAMKPARELYVGNLPPNVTGPQLQEFLGTIIQQVGLCAQPGNPIVNTWISTDGHFAFCEMRSVEECNLALLLNQLSLLGQPLKFGRPRSYMGPPQPLPVISARTQTALVNLGCTPNPIWFASSGLGGAPGLGGAAPSALPVQPTYAAPLPAPSYIAAPSVATPAPPAAPSPAALLSSLPADPSSKRLLLSNIPVVLVESQVKELVEPFGELKSFTLLTDSSTGASTGNAVFEYEDESVGEEALQGLNGLDIGGIALSIRRAPHDANGLLPADETSVVIKLANMVSLDELKDDEEFSDLKEDVEEECKRFGTVVDMVIPRPREGDSVPGVGNIYMRFNEKSEAASAVKALSGRKFGGNIVKATYYALAKFESKEFA